MINAERLACMKPTAFLVNIARGDIVDEDALAESLRTGRIAGAGIDVCRAEPLLADSTLWDVPNLIITPHCAGLSPNRRRRLIEFFCRNLRLYLDGEPLLNVVDRHSSVSRSARRWVRSWRPRKKMVVNVMGDAALGMVGMDVETAVREQIPILTLLLNNSAMGNYERHIPIASERYGTKFLSGNYSQVARGLGAHSKRVEQPGEIVPALEEAIRATRDGKPALLEFITREEPDMAIG